MKKLLTWHKYAIGGIVLAAIGVPILFPKITTSPLTSQTGLHPYIPQPTRNASDFGVPNGTYSDDQVNMIATNVGVLDIPKFHAGYDIQKQFVDVKRVVDAGTALGNPVQVYGYYNATYWFLNNFPGTKKRSNGWGDYTKNFSTDWYLKDTNGSTITHREDRGDAFVVDLSNPDYRAYAIATIADWMKQAPFAGIKFDSANLLEGQTVDKRIQNNGKTWNELLCGGNVNLDAKGNCPRVAAWNAGLQSLIASAKQTLAPMGKLVYYNGISPSKSHGDDRNLSILSTADGAMNETFCYGEKGNGDITLYPLADDIALMKSQSALGKRIAQITSSGGTLAAKKYEPYCLAGFLMGWQPGFNYWVYQTSYSDAPATLPLFADQGLNLGLPVGDAVQSGNVFTRTFANGYVILNVGTTQATLALPNQRFVQFANGRQLPGGVLAAGKTVVVPAQSGAFFLNETYAIKNTILGK